MKAIVLTSLIGAVALAGAIQPTLAQSPNSYPYCLQFIGGPISCYYANLRQCWAATYDRGGVCVSNPFRQATGTRLRRVHSIIAGARALTDGAAGFLRLAIHCSRRRSLSSSKRPIMFSGIRGALASSKAPVLV